MIFFTCGVSYPLGWYFLSYFRLYSAPSFLSKADFPRVAHFLPFCPCHFLTLDPPAPIPPPLPPGVDLGAADGFGLFRAHPSRFVVLTIFASVPLTTHPGTSGLKSGRDGAGQCAVGLLDKTPVWRRLHGRLHAGLQKFFFFPPPICPHFYPHFLYHRSSSGR